MRKTLSDFVKKGISFEEKLLIISDWEADRCSDGEDVYDLDDDCDAKLWVDLYDAPSLYRCRAEGRFWLGGANFVCGGNGVGYSNTEAFCLTETKVDAMLTDSHILGEIADRFEDIMRNSNNKQSEIVSHNTFYTNLIDFEGYWKSKQNERYIWVATSHDGSYETHSKFTFEKKSDCYNEMRRTALLKMEWNTEYKEDFEYDECTIGYEVSFSKERIIHSSYSGIYIYKIIDADDYKDCSEFWTALREEAQKYGKVM